MALWAKPNKTMENEENLNADNTNGEEVEKEVVADTTTEQPEEPKFTDAERKAFARAKVAEAKVKELKAQLETQAPSKKSDGLDYGEKSFLISNGIKGAKEFEFVQAELKKSGSRDLDALLENGYFKTQLENFRALAQTADATPTGKRSSGVATDSVEYWVAKAGPNAENLAEVPTEMRTKVVNALHAKAKDTGKFYNQ
jgi:hypothetical protein